MIIIDHEKRILMDDVANIAIKAWRVMACEEGATVSENHIIRAHGRAWLRKMESEGLLRGQRTGTGSSRNRKKVYSAIDFEIAVRSTRQTH